MKMQRYIVTGGAGFIGSHLVERLIEEGHEATVIDNFSTGRPDNLSHIKSGRLKVIEANVSDLEKIMPFFKNIDVVFHLAALADIVPSISRPMDYYEANVSGTACVIEAARLAGSKHLIYAASSSCYGIPDVYPTPETAEIRPQYPYAVTKYLGEQIVLYWGEVYKLPVISLRLFNVYGPRSRTSGTYGAVFGVFLAQKLHGKPFTIVGDGTQVRDFAFVTDIVNAFLMAANSDLGGEVLNVGAGTTYSVNHLAELLGSNGNVVYIPKRPGEPDCTHADIAKVKRLLGWEPGVSFEDGVAKILENIEYWGEAPVWTPETIKETTEEWFRYLSK